MPKDIIEEIVEEFRKKLRSGEFQSFGEMGIGIKTIELTKYFVSALLKLQKKYEDAVPIKKDIMKDYNDGWNECIEELRSNLSK